MPVTLLQQARRKPSPGQLLLNPNSPLSNGMTFGVPFVEVGGLLPADYARGRPATAGLGTLAWETSTGGASPGPSAGKFAATILNYGTGSIVTGGTATFVMSIKPSTLTGPVGFINKRDTADTNNAFAIGIGFNTNTTNVSMQIGPLGSTCGYESATTTWTTTAYQQIVMTYDSSRGTGARWALYRNGVSIAVTVLNESNPSFLDTPAMFSLGQINSNNAFPYTGGMEYCYIYSRAFTQGDVSLMFAEPYSMWAQRPARRYDQMLVPYNPQPLWAPILAM